MKARALIALFAMCTACDGTLLHLGSNEDAGDAFVAPTDAALPEDASESLSCPPLTELTLPLFEGKTCAFMCEDSVEPLRAFATENQLAAALAGQWQICSGGVGPTNEDGIEFDVGCIVFFLHRQDGGSYVRGTSADEQATYDVVTRNGEVRSFLLHLTSGDIEIVLRASDCLGRSQFVLPDGGTVDLVNENFQDGGMIPAK